jgi:hypothetical protein
VHPQRPCRHRTCRGCRTLHQVTKSLLVMRKSPTSAWRRSMSSTRRTQDRFAAWCRKLAAADAEAAAAAEAVEDAGAAAVADAAVAAEAAACRGALAACAKRGRVPNTLTNARRHGRVRRGRPGQFVSSWRSSRCVGGRTRMTAELIFHPVENGQRALDQGAPVRGECALKRRSGAASNMRVMSE